MSGIAPPGLRRVKVPRETASSDRVPAQGLPIIRHETGDNPYVPQGRGAASGLMECAVTAPGGPSCIFSGKSSAIE